MELTKEHSLLTNGKADGRTLLLVATILLVEL